MQLPTRSQRDPSSLWRLQDIYATNEAWEEEYSFTKSAIPALAEYSGRLHESASVLAEALAQHADMEYLLDKLYVYAHMRRDEDNAVSLYQGMTDRAMGLMVEAESAAAFLTPEILTLPEETLARWLSEPCLAIYRHLIREMTHARSHTLTESEEQLLALTGEMAQGPEQIHTMLTETDLVFPSITDGEGHELQVTQGRFHSLMENRDRAVREAAFRAMYGTLQSYQNTMAAALVSSIRTDVFYSRARRYASPLEASLHPDAVPVSLYRGLIAAVREHLPLLHRYVTLKKQALGLSEMHMYDLYVPLVDQTDMHFTYKEGCQTVAEGLSPLGGEYLGLMQEGMHAGWVDVYENKGKTSGAYAWGIWGVHPFVLLNWQGTVDDVMTLAHEMGHAMHSHYSNTEQPFVSAGYKLILAEIASTCNEALLMNHLIAKAQDAGQSLYLLNHLLEQFRCTLFRQVMFAEFEMITHEMALDGKPLTAESLREVYHQLNVDYYGPDMVVDELVDMEWARIPHFYRSFYVYKYATGFAAAIALSDAIQYGGQAELARYKAFLASGNTDFPLTLLRRAGVDLETPEPVRAAMHRFEQTLNRMASIVTNKET